MGQICDLPEAIIGNILSFLPLAEAVRTSVLSKQWRRHWTHITHLNANDPNQWAIAVNSILSSLQGAPVVSCSLCCPENFNRSADIDRFLFILVRSRIQKLKLFPSDVYSIQKLKLFNSPINRSAYSIPLCLFNSPITELVLRDCEFPLSPPSFHCWSRLTSIDLEWVLISDIFMTTMLASCNLLERLSLKLCSGLQNLRISCPNLLYLCIYCIHPIIVCLERATKLETLILYIAYNIDKDASWEALDSILRLPESVKNLKLNLGLDMVWPERHELKTPLSIFHNLKKLKTKTYLVDANYVSFFACLLRCSPRLEKLVVEVRDPEDVPETAEIDFWDGQRSFACLAHHLVTVKIFLGHSDEHSMSFVKYVLGNSPLLRRMDVLFYLSLSQIPEVDIFSTMKKASPHAQIKVRYRLVQKLKLGTNNL